MNNPVPGCGCTAYAVAKELKQAKKEGRPPELPPVIHLGVAARICRDHPKCGGVE